MPARGYDPDQFRSEASHAETEAALGMDLSSISEKQVPTWTFFADKARQQLVLFDASLPISGGLRQTICAQTFDPAPPITLRPHDKDR